VAVMWVVCGWRSRGGLYRRVSLENIIHTVHTRYNNNIIVQLPNSDDIIIFLFRILLQYQFIYVEYNILSIYICI